MNVSFSTFLSLAEDEFTGNCVIIDSAYTKGTMRMHIRCATFDFVEALKYDGGFS